MNDIMAFAEFFTVLDLIRPIAFTIGCNFRKLMNLIIGVGICQNNSRVRCCFTDNKRRSVIGLAIVCDV